MHTLTSYVAGRWQEGTGEARALLDPTSGETVAQLPSGGIDFAEMTGHARDVGGPALRALNFAERGQLLKDLSAAIHAEREELIELGRLCGGNTRGDAKFDIDGATGTLAAYAYYARSLGERKTLPDGEGVQLGRTARYWGQHILSPRVGVAVHINAFNFPAWGMFEKAACALLAGMPVIEKPGSPTALLAWRLAQITVDSGVLPEGAFQFVAGSAGDLLDHLGPQDCLAFTGSARTGALLRGHGNVVAHNVRVNVEADSLNAAVLAPDVESDSETYGAFLSNVVTDMTQKAGQKCTAVRRILVPAERVKEVQADLIAELGRIQMGDPADRDHRLGPLTDEAQLEDVRAGIGRLSEVAEVVLGGSEPTELGGCFVTPTLLVAADSRADVLHELEVFGPVSTILPYTGSVEEAVELVNLGGGGLVTSLYSNDVDWTETYVMGVAPWHGRVWIASDRGVSQSLPPGMVLPASIHGGPGRAGGGEELGAERGLAFYMQRTALQGFKGFLDPRFGTPAEAE
ncbi:MAG: 3,4-dehydroadipyl-CoA semialdehyde dehydrogenase [Planctomycetota bacterium]|jgi:oxepin-CoA hydrolase/3-oxo-5,6-dehydrosuberyl-CoA semialdehyde dehydrogenase|nr:aldehyde dehydrogenase [Candidatus Woesearchaeota archaeon]MDP6385777.1 3,4-dehydroadipyl-CoA semialdehyde dehydrogenase [Planctomycetota bacterium]MDP6937612.1 3,4-dehydroadipyl-CoA semialdehyde dehydrogenase [Planctomycetota bacterium]